MLFNAPRPAERRTAWAGKRKAAAPSPLRTGPVSRGGEWGGGGGGSEAASSPRGQSPARALASKAKKKARSGLASKPDSAVGLGFTAVRARASHGETPFTLSASGGARLV